MAKPIKPPSDKTIDPAVAAKAQRLIDNIRRLYKLGRRANSPKNNLSTEDFAAANGIDMAAHLIDLLAMFAGPVRRVAALVRNLVQDYKPAGAGLQTGRRDHNPPGVPLRRARHRRLLLLRPRRGQPHPAGGVWLTRGAIERGGDRAEHRREEGFFAAAAKGYDATQNKGVARTFERIPFPKVNPYTAECESFARCILEGRAPTINDGKNALSVLRIVEQALQSYKTKAIIAVR